MKYLLDTNICIYFLKGKFQLDKKIAQTGIQNCAISEITYAELIYGAEKSDSIEKNLQTIEKFTDQIVILPIFNAIHVFGKEKARLRSKGNMISEANLTLPSEFSALSLRLSLNKPCLYPQILVILLWHHQIYIQQL